MPSATLVVLVALSLLRCTSTSELTHERPSVVRDEITSACDAGTDTCQTGGSPRLCFATRYDGSLLASGHPYKGWGRGRCRAKQALKQEACRLGADPKKLGRVNCVPDSAKGQCPPIADASCDMTTNQQRGPTICMARQYAGSTLTPDQAVAGWGGGACEAQRDLRRRACLLLLRPDQLQDVICASVTSPKSCPVKTFTCSSRAKPTTCVASLPGVKQRLRVFGLNRCLAERDLALRACSLNKSPDDLQGLTCR